MTARTLFEKIWADHVIVVSPQGEELLYVDFNLINEGQSFLAFDQLRENAIRKPWIAAAADAFDLATPVVHRGEGFLHNGLPACRRYQILLSVG